MLVLKRFHVHHNEMCHIHHGGNHDLAGGGDKRTESETGETKKRDAGVIAQADMNTAERQERQPQLNIKACKKVSK